MRDTMEQTEPTCKVILKLVDPQPLFLQTLGKVKTKEVFANVREGEARKRTQSKKMGIRTPVLAFSLESYTGTNKQKKRWERAIGRKR